MANPTYLLALDQGTTSSRTLLFDLEGNAVASSQKELTQHFPQPGWVEHDAEEIWDDQLATIRETLDQANVSKDAIAAIGITNQRETAVIWDRATGKPIGNAIVWQDRRTASICKGFKDAGKEAAFQEKTGLVLDPYFSGTKIKWMLENIPGARERAEAGELAFGTIDSWLIWNLTGGKTHATDVSNASRTLLFNIHTMDWDDELLTLLEIPKSLLPKVVNSSGIIAEASCCNELAGIPISGVAGDQQSALFGQQCFEAGSAKNTYGTGCFLLMNTGDKPVTSKNKLLTTVAWRIGDQTTYALEGSVFVGGAAIQWLRDGLQIIDNAPDVEALAETVDSTDGVYLVPAFTGLGAPYWNPAARGNLSGISRGTTKAHIARAALESIAYQSTDVLHAMEEDSGIKLKELRVDGGAAQNNLLMQFQSNITDVNVIRAANPEITALGSALLAGLGVGAYSSINDLPEIKNNATLFTPDNSFTHRKELIIGWHKAVGTTLHWADS